MKRTVHKAALWLAAAALAAGLAGCGTTGSKSTGTTAVVDEQSADPAAQKAAQLYKSSCVACHGNQLEGRMGAKSSLKNVGSKLSAEQIREKIVKGGNGMIGFKDRLKDDEIQALTDWLAAKK